MGSVAAGEDANEARAKWNTWLRSRHDTYLGQLSEAVATAGRKSALRTFCGVVASSPVPLQRDGSIDAAKKSGGEVDTVMINQLIVRKLLESLVRSGGCFDDTEKASNDDGDDEARILDESLLTLFESEFVRPHRDAQYFVMKGLRQIACDLYKQVEEERKDVQREAKSKPKGKSGKKDKKQKKKEKKVAEENDSEDGEEVGNDEKLSDSEKKVGLAAENMIRVLMSMGGYVARTNEQLADEASFLFSPPAVAADVAGSDDEDEEGYEVVDEEGEGSDGDDSSSSDGEDSEDDDDATKKRKSAALNGRSPKRARKNDPAISWQKSRKHRQALQEAWLAILRLPGLPLRTQKRALQHIPAVVLPIVTTPLRFSEYFTQSFSKVGGVSSVLSLHGLFVLLTEHGLEFPQFYARLYSLLRPRVLYAKHRTRFLRLLVKCLSGSSMLPAYVVASFCKRLCRAALAGPPSGALFALALVSNLLRRHGEVACLIHRNGNVETGRLKDVYDDEEEDPSKSRALESSLWELTALESHYHPAVSSLAKSCGTESDLTQMHDMDDFLAHTYKSLFDQEHKRGDQGGKGGKGGGGGGKGRGKKVAVTFVEPTSLFTEDDVFRSFLLVPAPSSSDSA